jgi:16S rRNA processing protein RimM
MPAQDLLIIKTEAGEVLLPFVKAFVPKVDVSSGIIEITPPGGLFEEIEEADAN